MCNNVKLADKIAKTRVPNVLIVILVPAKFSSLYEKIEYLMFIVFYVYYSQYVTM